MYAYAMDGLLELEAEETAALLNHAKDRLFDATPVPVDTESRREYLRSRVSSPELEDLDKKFWLDGEKLGERCKQYALRHGLHGDA